MQHSSELRPVAVFDYDGTCIDGQSGRLIATWLFGKGYISARAMAGLTWWGIRYKLHLPHRQEYARERIFASLQEREGDIDAIMVEFHEEVLVPRYRPLALAEVSKRKSEGCEVVLVSATFDAIAREAAHRLGANGFVATKMEVDDEGRYTGRVQGEVVAGTAKVDAVRSWADEALGKGTWRLAYAYGDHHSDIELLAKAACPVAVDPGPTLRKAARRNGWPIESWKVR